MVKVRKFPLSQNTSVPVYGLGLLTDEPDYRLCWLLNQVFPWNLVRSDDLRKIDKNSALLQKHVCFESRSVHHTGIRLIGNRSNEGLWLTVFRQVDFLLAFPVEDPAGSFPDEVREILGTKIPQIRGVFKIPLPSFCYL